MCLADHALHGLAEAIGFASTCPQFSPTLRCAQPPFACPLTSPSKNSCASTHSLPATDKYQPRAPLPTNRTSLATQLLPNLQAAASTIASATRPPQPTQAASASFAKTPTPLRLPSAGLRRFATFGGHVTCPTSPTLAFQGACSSTRPPLNPTAHGMTCLFALHRRPVRGRISARDGVFFASRSSSLTFGLTIASAARRVFPDALLATLLRLKTANVAPRRSRVR